MVVGGLPTSCDDHADKVANMACSMLDAVTQVHSPVDSQPIKVRITTANIQSLPNVLQHIQHLLDCLISIPLPS